MRRSRLLPVLCAFTAIPLLAALVLPALAQPPQEKPAPTLAKPDPFHASPEDIAKWRQLKFGMFIHWGPVSLKGVEIGWGRGRARPDQRQGGGGSIPVEVYDNLYKEFNPTKFDAQQWVEIAKAAGMRYMVFTARHHDGFSMFDSKLTDYKITSPDSPYRKDIVKQLSDACHQGGLVWGVYYSQPDWHHPDYRTANHARFIPFVHGQVRELLTNYGAVGMLFFDGLGGSAKDWDATRLIPMCRQLQPHIIINDRCGLPADYSTPEQEIGRMNTVRPWETCMTIGDQWAWKPNDRIKSVKQCIQTLVRCVGGDGNLLFNVGPMPDGRIEPRQVERLKAMGQWLANNGESIYNTRGGPFRPGAWGVSTHRDNLVFLHILDPKLDKVVLPPVPKRVLSASELRVPGGALQVQQTDQSIEVSLPKNARDEIDTIVVLKLDGLAADVKPGRLNSVSLATCKKARASNVFQNQTDAYGPDKALDDDPETRWATDAGTHEAWIEVDLGRPAEIAGAMIDEAYAGRVEQFQLQVKHGDSWKTVATGKGIGAEFPLRFPPTTAQVVRLSILNASEGPTINEFQLYAPKK